MLAEATLNTTFLRLTDFYKVNQNRISDNMVRVASGKRFSQPADDTIDFFHTRQITTDISCLDRVKRDISVGNAMLDVAKGAGTVVFEDLTRMKELVNLYYDASATDDERSAYSAEFKAIQGRIADAIDTTYYNDKKLIADNGPTPLRSIMIDARDVNEKYDISFDANDVADASGLTLGASDRTTELAALQMQLDRAASYLNKATVYSDALAIHASLTDQKSMKYGDNVNDTEHIDEGAEMMALTKRNICQQMTVSMLAQANMFQSAVLGLVRNK